LNRISRLSLFFVLVCLAFAADDPDKATFDRVCGKCHSTTMISDLKSEEEWIETVQNMVSIGAKGTDDEFHQVQRYLARNFTKVNINTATAAQIAPVLDIAANAAQIIVDYRAAHGTFDSLDQLKKIPGVDAAKIEARKDRIALR
jgi:competence protein ComEA